MKHLGAMKERLSDLKTFLLDEHRSSKPSKAYIEDLEGSIKAIEGDIAQLEFGRKHAFVHVGKVNGS